MSVDLTSSCKFCWRGKSHTDDCPRDTPGAEQRYEQGYRAGRRGGNPTSVDPAYRAGYRDGISAHESWFNGSDGSD